jgi:hypothetical protein
MVNILTPPVTARPRSVRPVLMLVCGLVAVGAGVLVTAPVPATAFWLGALWVVWGASSMLVLSQRNPSFAFVGLQALMLIFVVIPATIATNRGAIIAGYDFSLGTPAALRMAVVAQIGFTAGLVLTRTLVGSSELVRVRTELPARQLDLLAISFVIMAVGSLVLFSFISGADITKVNVLAQQNDYGDFQKSATGSSVKYFLVLQGLAGASLVLATLRLTCARARSRTVPVVIILVVFAMLGISGQRSRLIVPLLAAGLVWWKTSQGRLSVRPRTIMAVGGAVLLVLVSWIGYIRVNPDEREFDPVDAVTEQFERADLFSLSAGLVQNIPQRRDYLYGDSYIEAATIVVPRAVWEGKPEGSSNEVVGTFMVLGTGVSFPIYAEMFYNFGLVGVIAGTVMFGALLEYVYLRFVRAGRVTSMLLWVSLVPILLQASMRGYLAGQVAGASGILLGLLITVWYLRRRVPAADADAGPERSDLPVPIPAA